MHRPIKISSESEFFVAICTYNLHSYVTLGVKNGEKTEVLAAVGKVAGLDPSACAFLFWNTEGFVHNERFMFGHKKDNEVAYKAYAINYKHYIEFLDYIKQLSIAQKNAKNLQFSLSAYCPDLSDPSLLIWQSVEKFSTPQPMPCATDLETHGRIGAFGNSCRHSAIRLTHQATKRADLGAAASTLFFRSPPLTAVFSGGIVQKITPYFYILPLPPTLFEAMEPKKLTILTRLYRRLDEIVLSEQNNPVTIEKFQKIKDLYTHLTRDSQLSIMDVISGIETWEIEHQALISTHRKSHWISFQTSTQKMFSNLHEDFDAIRIVPVITSYSIANCAH